MIALIFSKYKLYGSIFIVMLYIELTQLLSEAMQCSSMMFVISWLTELTGNVFSILSHYI